jgi:hypothetical protein
MSMPTFDSIEMWKGPVGGSFAVREEFRQSRDARIVGLVNRYGIISAADLAARIGYAATPQGTQDAYELLKRIKEAGEIQLIIQYGIHYGISVDISLRKKGAKAQLVHRALESTRRQALDQVVMFEEYRTGEMLRAAAKENDVIPDGFGRIGERGWFFEDETGSHTTGEMVEKAARYHSQLERLQTLFNVQRIQVVWGLKIWTQVVTLVPDLRTIGTQGGLFLVCHHPRAFDLRRISWLRDWPQFYSPLDDLDPKEPMPRLKFMES